MEIVNMRLLEKGQCLQAARLLTDRLPVGWPTLAEAEREIHKLLAPENTLLAAVENGEVLGLGGILSPTYGGNVCELHPLAVRQSHAGRGVGTALIGALEQAAREKGVRTIWLGSDDEKEGGETSLSGVDLFANLPDKLRDFLPGTHASAFYLKMGYRLIGVMPDANGQGKPDLYFGKRLQP